MLQVLLSLRQPLVGQLTSLMLLSGRRDFVPRERREMIGRHQALVAPWQTLATSLATDPLVPGTG
jgi:hypothetical protein